MLVILEGGTARASLKEEDGGIKVRRGPTGCTPWGKRNVTRVYQDSTSRCPEIVCLTRERSLLEKKPGGAERLLRGEEGE